MFLIMQRIYIVERNKLCLKIVLFFSKQSISPLSNKLGLPNYSEFVSNKHMQ